MDYDPQKDNDRRKKFYISRTIDLGQIATIMLVFLGGLTALGSVYWSVSNRIDGMSVNIAALETQNKLLQQQLAQDEHAADAAQRQMQQYVADTREWEKGFSTEIRSDLKEITQAVANLQTSLARDGKR